jgi:hypothetical protein
MIYVAAAGLQYSEVFALRALAFLGAGRQGPPVDGKGLAVTAIVEQNAFVLRRAFRLSEVEANAGRTDACIVLAGIARRAASTRLRLDWPRRWVATHEQQQN